MAIEDAHVWAEAVHGEAVRAREMAEEILASKDPTLIRAVADDMIGTADQLRRDAGQVQARIDSEEG